MNFQAWGQYDAGNLGFSRWQHLDGGVTCQQASSVNRGCRWLLKSPSSSRACRAGAQGRAQAGAAVMVSTTKTSGPAHLCPTPEPQPSLPRDSLPPVGFPLLLPLPVCAEHLPGRAGTERTGYRKSLIGHLRLWWVDNWWPASNTQLNSVSVVLAVEGPPESCCRQHKKANCRERCGGVGSAGGAC